MLPWTRSWLAESSNKYAGKSKVIYWRRWGHRVAVYGTRSSHPWALDNPLPAYYGPVDSYPIPFSYLTS
jgi:hypothetical protein